MITFRCEKCAVLVQTPARKAGRPVTCNKCQHVTMCPPASVVNPLRPPRAAGKKRQVGSPAFLATIGAIGLACLVWTIWTVATLS
jgi:hypothetical protein